MVRCFLRASRPEAVPRAEPTCTRLVGHRQKKRSWLPDIHQYRKAAARRDQSVNPFRDACADLDSCGALTIRAFGHPARFSRLCRWNLSTDSDRRSVMPSFSLSRLILFAIFAILVVRMIGKFSGNRSNTGVAPRGAGSSGNAFCTIVERRFPVVGFFVGVVARVAGKTICWRSGRSRSLTKSAVSQYRQVFPRASPSATRESLRSSSRKQCHSRHSKFFASSGSPWPL